MAPRAGLTRGRVVDAAAIIADRDGLDAVTLAQVASALGVRAPSLYNHVDGLDDLGRELTLRALTLLGERLQAAAVGRAGPDAVRAVARAYRAFAHEHPGLYPAVVRTSEGSDAEIQALGTAVVATVVATLRGYPMDEAERLHATRTLRSAVHGFVSLELAGGFGLDLDLETLFSWLVDTLVLGLSERQGVRRRRPRDDEPADPPHG